VGREAAGSAMTPTSRRRPALLTAAGSSILLLGILVGTRTAAAVRTVDVAVAASSDDAEEAPSGSVSRSSSDLELATDGTKVQTVGVRFARVDVPRGAIIRSAQVRFQTDETSSAATSLRIQAQAADNAPTFQRTAFDVSSRPRTAAAVTWAPPWTVVGEAGPAERTPDLAAVLSEVVARPGWAAGNALVIIVTGTGERVAGSFDGGKPPVLQIAYESVEGTPSPSPSPSPSSSPAPTPSGSPSGSPTPTPTTGRVLCVPGDAATMQAAIDRAVDGDTVLVAPGTYRENPTIAGKSITLASQFLETGDPSAIAQTIIDGGGADVVRIGAGAGPGPTITGFTIRNGGDGIKAAGPFRLVSNVVTQTSDGVDTTDVREALIRDNALEGNADDGIDFDGASGA
jgi:hypothetical protein